ncbi:uncharacterized protein [Drosophila takahashii]|uniref:uncharacterized protein n=1 Tax=Drosophila takahashii TaxID=29030 RepID=UPI001CF81667|nr:uncharacterized protein LOC108064562 [Drosophila takahashii]
MSGSIRSRSLLGIYEYIMPGIYDYRVTHSAAATISAYQLDPVLDSDSSSWSIPDTDALYVAGPLGVINYLSDVQTHLALPTSQNLETGLIYTTISSMSPDTYIHHYVQVENDLVDDEGYGYEIPQLDLCLDHLISESDRAEQEEVHQSSDSQHSSKGYSSVEISEESRSGEPEPIKEEEVPKKRKKISHRRIYEAEQGYLVEEPTSEQSEDDTELPHISRT